MISPAFKKTIQSDLLLIFVAMIWGLAFVAQRQGAGHIPALVFVAIRYLLGALSLFPVIAFINKKNKVTSRNLTATETGLGNKNTWLAALPGGLSLGAVLFLASYLQQEALIISSAGQAGFITSLYVVLVPMIGIIIGKYKLTVLNGASLVIAVVGLYLLSVQGNFQIAPSDLILVVSAFLYALHIVLIDYFGPKTDSLRLSALQFIVAGLLAVGVTLIFRIEWSWLDIKAAAVPLLYTGIFSSGVAYTLQIVAQDHAQASHAAILMSSESIFAAVGGVLFLSEVMQGRAIIGACLMFVAGIISQMGSLSAQGFLTKNKRS